LTFYASDIAFVGCPNTAVYRDSTHQFDTEQTTPGHYGLSMMRERATAVGATLSIASQPGHGTEIIVRWVETQEQKAD